jgi:hypothetical protein
MTLYQPSNWEFLSVLSKKQIGGTDLNLVGPKKSEFISDFFFFKVLSF